MPSLRLAGLITGLTTGLTTVAALTAPGAAHAAAADATAYQPITVKDHFGDAESSSGKIWSAPEIDITRVHAERYRRSFAVVVTFLDLHPSAYTRHQVTLTGPATSGGGERSRTIELRSAADPGSTTTQLYDVRSGDATSSTTAVRCAGAGATPHYRTNTIRYVLPLACYDGIVDGSAGLHSLDRRWTAGTWTPGNLSASTSAPRLSDVSDSTWTWATTRAMAAGS